MNAESDKAIRERKGERKLKGGSGSGQREGAVGEGEERDEGGARAGEGTIR